MTKPPEHDVTAKDLLEDSAILWKRDWDALFVGFALGVLTATVVLLTVIL